MDLTFLDSFDVAVQEAAVELYWEIRGFIATSNTSLPESLSGIISNILMSFNESKCLNKTYKEENENMKSIAQRVAKERDHYKVQLNAERKHLETMKQEMEVSDRNTGEDKNEINKLKNELSRMGTKVVELKQMIENTRKSQQNGEEQQKVIGNLKTSLETMEAAWKLDQKQIQVLKGQLWRQTTHDTVTLDSQHSGAATPTTCSELTLDRELEDARKSNRNSGEQNLAQQKPKSCNNVQFSNLSSSNKDKSEINVFLTGDSHIRGLREILLSKVPLNSSVNFKSSFKPGAKIKDVVDSITPETLDNNTKVFFMAGTNDLFQTSADDIRTQLDRLHNKLSNFQ
ncbi:Hypothetical predicted protein, partial [Olea europaea subsp. europaea]